MLAKSNDRRLQLVAKGITSTDLSAAELAQLADAWWQIAQAEGAIYPQLALAQAGDLYESALPELTGAEHQTAVERLAKIPPRAEPDLQKGLIAYWTFDEREGVSAADSHDGHDLSIFGAGKWVDGKVGNALQLDDGTSVYLNRADTSATFERDEAFSLGGWIQLNTGFNGVGTIFSKGLAYDKPRGRGYALDLERFRLRLTLASDGAGDQIVVRSTRPIGRGWKHVYVTYDGSGKARGVRLYVSGELQPVEIAADTLSKEISNDDQLQIGSTPTRRRIQRPSRRPARLRSRSNAT